MSYFSRFIQNLRPSSDRGATGVEYALVVSMVLVGSSASIEMMDDRVETHYSETAYDVGRTDLSDFDVTTTTCGSCTTTSTTSTTTTAPATTTTAPASTTTAPASTTTAPATTTSTTTTSTTTTVPTSTTSPPATTTTAAPAGEAATLSANNWSGYWGGQWLWDVYGQIRVRDDNGDRLTSASVQYTITLATGETATYNTTTNSYGKFTIDWWGHESSSIFPATITIDSITKNGDDYIPEEPELVWDAT